MRVLTTLPTSLLALLFLPTTSLADDLQIEVIEPVTCSRPTRLNDEISVHYRGSLLSTGAVFDESFKRGKPITFNLGRHEVITGWDQGLLDMCPGEARKLTIPPELAYGERGRPPVIPGGSTLVFDTLLVEIVGVREEWVSAGTAVETVAGSESAYGMSPSTSMNMSMGMSTSTSTKTDEVFSIETAPSKPPPGFDEETKVDEVEDTPELEGQPLTSQTTTTQEGECHLLGPFALLVQGALGAVALLSLVYKRWRETPKRPWKIFFFDVSKQVLGSFLTHALNLAMSILGSVDLVNVAKQAAATAKAEDGTESGGGGGGSGRRSPNPCSFYILNLGIDTTLGIPILYLLLKILHAAFLFTPLARPRESIKSGHYGSPPKSTWWLKQSLIYFLGLTGMKLFVLALFAILPWLPWVGDWALRWTEGNEALQIAVAMFLFPLAMNAVQYWVIDSFIMEKRTGEDDSGAYERVRSREGDEDEDRLVEDEIEVHAKVDDDDEDDVQPALKEVIPTPIPTYDDQPAEGSRCGSPQDTENDDEQQRKKR